MCPPTITTAQLPPASGTCMQPWLWCALRLPVRPPSDAGSERAHPWVLPVSPVAAAMEQCPGSCMHTFESVSFLFPRLSGAVRRMIGRCSGVAVQLVCGVRFAQACVARGGCNDAGLLSRSCAFSGSGARDGRCGVVQEKGGGRH
eukprot:361857-Chlamydomonas_euryale.AAC.5